MSKIIITAAITGAIHIPAMSDYLPLTPEQIVEDAVKAWETGAAIAHIHVRLPENGKPTADVALFKEVLGEIKSRCDLVLLPTTGGGQPVRSGKADPGEDVETGDVLLRSCPFQSGDV